MKNILITGGTGFVATALLDLINNLENRMEYSISLSMRKNPQDEFLRRFSNLNIEILQADLTLPWSFDDKYDTLINLAAQGDINPYSNQANNLYESINSNLICWANRKRELRKIFHASSGAVYGKYLRTPAGKIYQDFKIDQWEKKEFSIIREKVENNILEMSGNTCIQVIIGRLFSFAGIDLLMRDNYAITNFIRSGIQNKAIEIRGSIYTTRSYLSQVDLANWIKKSIESEEHFPILNFGSSVPVTLMELANFIALKTNAEIIAKNTSEGDYYVADNTNTRESLSVKESIDWKIEVQNMINLELAKYQKIGKI